MEETPITEPEPPTYTPRWAVVGLRCGACRHRWQDWLPGECPAPALIAQMKYIARRGCPACNSRKVLIDRA